MGALIVFFFVGIGAVIIFYASAKFKLKNYENDRRDYQLLVENLGKLENRLQGEADHWPIYARPMLFTDVDHESQLEFAQAQKAMNEAHSITPDLQEIIAQPIVKPSLLGIFENIRIIIMESRFRSQIYSLAHRSIDLTRSIIAINNNQAKINQKRSLVKVNIRKLQVSIDEANQQVNDIEKSSAGSNTQIYWTISTAQEAHDFARKEILPKPNSELEDDQGDLAFAVADVYVTIGNIALKCFRLYCDSLKEIGRYELDIFRGLFQETIDHLHSILKIKDINGWKKLRRAKLPIDEFPEKEAQARLSLDDFRQKSSAFEKVEQQLSGLEWDARIAGAHKVQEKCSRYWSPYQENKSEWQLVLGNRILPKIRFIQLRDLCISNIIPATRLGVLIQQSSLPALTSTIENILNEVGIAASDVDNLNREYEKHWNAEELVRSLVSREGQLYMAISRAQQISVDSDEDLTGLCLTSIERYKGFIERIKMVRGANFPELAGQCNLLLAECNELINKHRARAAECEMKYKQALSVMQASLSELRKYIDISPSLDPQHISRLEQLAVTCKLLLEESTGNRYLSMRSLLGRMQEWNQTGSPFIAQTKARMERFNLLCGQTENSIIRAIAFMNNNRSRADRKPGWSTDDILNIIERANNNLTPLVNTWERYKKFNWPEMTLQRAAAECQNIMDAVEKIEADMLTRISAIDRELISFQRLGQEILDRAAQNNLQITEADMRLISRLCQIGMRAPTREFAKRSMNLAEELATQPISIRLRREAQITINDYRETINTQGGAYVGGSVTVTGNGRFTGRDSK